MTTPLPRAIKALSRSAVCLLLMAALPAMAQEPRIDWDAVRRDAAASPVNIAMPVNRPVTVLADVPLPVLLPALPEPVLSREGGPPGVLFFTRSGAYTASFRIGEVGLELTGMAGASLSHDAGDGVPATTRTEAGRDASFSRYGAGYTLSVTCPDPLADPACTEPGFARYVIDNLALAGGSGL